MQPPAPPPAPAQSAQATAQPAAPPVVSGLTLEAYVALHRALTKQGQTVQPVTPIEECYYKIGDLRQLLQLHGLTAGKFNRTELLAAIKGQALINPFSTSSSAGGAAAAAAPGTQQQEGSPELPFSAADALSAVLGAPQPASLATQPLRFIQLGGSLASAGGGAGVAVAAEHEPTPQPNSTTGAAALRPAAAPLAAAAATPAACLDSTGGATQTDTRSAAAPPGHQQQPSQQPPQQQLVAAQPQHVPTTQQQQQHAPAAPDPLHQLLSTLLNQHHASSAPGTVGAATAATAATTATAPTQPQPPATTATAVALLQQLLSRTAAATGAGGVQTPSLARPPQPAEGGPTPAAAAQAASAAGPTSASSAPGSKPSLPLHPAFAAAAVAQAAATSCLTDMPVPSHTPWLKAQLQWFAANGLRVAQQQGGETAAGDSGGGEGSLVGCRAGFVLIEQMQVVGPKNSILTLPPGFYEGMAVKYLGSSCNLEVCDYDCPSHNQHQFYRARILAPRAVPQPQPDSPSEASSLCATLAQADAAASGRPVLLILDLHPRLRAHSLEEMLQIPSAEQLQDAWVLLEHEEAEQEEPEEPCGTEAEAAPPAAPPAAGKRGRKPASSKPGAHKRSKP